MTSKQIQTINDPANVRGYVENHCTNIVEFYLPGVKHDAKKLLMAAQGARLAGYGVLIWYENAYGWKRGTSIDLLQKNDETLFQFYRDTNEYGLWYFCKTDLVSECMAGI